VFIENKTNLDDIKTLHNNLLPILQGEYDPNEVAIYWRKCENYILFMT